MVVMADLGPARLGEEFFSPFGAGARQQIDFLVITVDPSHPTGQGPDWSIAKFGR
jgi:hypothetical protein